MFIHILHQVFDIDVLAVAALFFFECPSSIGKPVHFRLATKRNVQIVKEVEIPI